MNVNRDMFNLNMGTAATTPGQQLDAYGNLIRLQVGWFWN